jgi:DNA end-binding protein Ku
VAYDQIVKGYEITPDQYVVVTPEELEAIEPRKTKTIDIEDFVDLEEIDPIFYDHPYYLLPGTGAEKPYKLLVTAMEDASKVAIARVVIRQKEQLVAIRPTGDILTMETMNFADEVVPHDNFDEAPGADVEAGKREVDMARQLIESLSAEFDPSKYKDTYRERVLELIERKAQGKEIAVQPSEEPQQVPDLMAALEASVNAARQNRESGGRPDTKPSANGGGKAEAKPKPKAKAKAKAKSTRSPEKASK